MKRADVSESVYSGKSASLLLARRTRDFVRDLVVIVSTAPVQFICHPVSGRSNGSKSAMRGVLPPDERFERRQFNREVIVLCKNRPGRHTEGVGPSPPACCDRYLFLPGIRHARRPEDANHRSKNLKRSRAAVLRKAQNSGHPCADRSLRRRMPTAAERRIRTVLAVENLGHTRIEIRILQTNEICKRYNKLSCSGSIRGRRGRHSLTCCPWPRKYCGKSRNQPSHAAAHLPRRGPSFFRSSAYFYTTGDA